MTDPRRNVRPLALLGAAGTVVLCACGGGNGTTGTNGGGSPLSATVAGTAYEFSTEAHGSFGANALVIAGYDAGQAHWLGITVTGVTGPGTYSLASSDGGVAEFESLTQGSAQWVTGYNGGTGSVTINSVSATGASGTFSFTGAASPGTPATGTISVTNGKFNVTF